MMMILSLFTNVGSENVEKCGSGSVSLRENLNNREGQPDITPIQYIYEFTRPNCLTRWLL